MKKNILMIVAGILISATAFSQNTFTLDKIHTRLSFSVKHWGISYVEGNFKTFDATFVSSKEDFSDAQITMTAQLNSINTEVEMRDNDLRSANWFEAEKFPAINFTSTSFEKVSGSNYKLIGNITMHGITKPISFDVVFHGKGKNSFKESYSYGCTITGKLNRNDFGIGAEPMPAGVAYEIKLNSNQMWNSSLTKIV